MAYEDKCAKNIYYLASEYRRSLHRIKSIIDYNPAEIWLHKQLRSFMYREITIRILWMIWYCFVLHILCISMIKSHLQISKKVTKFHWIFFLQNCKMQRFHRIFSKCSFHSFYLKCRQKQMITKLSDQKYQESK